MLERPTSKALHAARNRRHRARQRAGEAIAPIRYNGRILNGLVRSRWLDPDDCGDRRLIGEAIFRMLSEAFRDCD
jgi:hypothetical protein